MQGALVSTALTLMIPLIIFGGYCRMTFALLLKRETSRFYMTAKK